MNDKLTTEDYENICLRVKEKTTTWTISWLMIVFGATAFIVGFGVDRFMKDKAEVEITSLVNSTDFKRTLLDSLNARMVSVDAHYKEIIMRLSRYEELRNAPYSFASNGFSFVDTNGTAIFVEYGHGKTYEETAFKNKFHGAPLLFFSPTSGPPLGMSSIKTPFLTISELTDREFVVGDTRHHVNSIQFNSVAIGK